MTQTTPHARSWSEQTIHDTCNWSYGNHQGSITLSSMREAARDGCTRCKLLIDGIGRYTFSPYRPHRTTEATLSEYESDPGLELRVSVFNNKKTPLQVTVQYTGMSSKSGSLPMELCFYTHSGQSFIAGYAMPSYRLTVPRQATSLLRRSDSRPYSG